MTNFLGKALAFPPRPNGRGGLATVEGPDAVSDSLRAIIESAKGEHQFEPWLGWPIDAFTPIPDLDLAAELIKDAIIDAEDRVVHETLQVGVSLGDEGEMVVSVFYSISGEASARTLQHAFRRLA